MQRRIFIAINIPGQVKKRLIQKIEKWQDLPVRWVFEDNLHITLNFLGYIEDEKLPEICSTVRKAVEKFEGFEISLTKIIPGPSEKQARMIWAAGEKSEELKKIVEQIEKQLGIFVNSKKEFRPHITLGRIKKEKWNHLPAAPEIDEKINFVIPVGNVEILESVFEEGKRKYLLLESCPLK